jgi:hypothetical protein
MFKDFYKLYVISNGINDFYQTDKITQEDIKNGYRLIKVLFRYSTKTLWTINF